MLSLEKEQIEIEMANRNKNSSYYSQENKVSFVFLGSALKQRYISCLSAGQQIFYMCIEI